MKDLPKKDLRFLQKELVRTEGSLTADRKIHLGEGMRGCCVFVAHICLRRKKKARCQGRNEVSFPHTDSVCLLLFNRYVRSDAINDSFSFLTSVVLLENVPRK